MPVTHPVFPVRPVQFVGLHGPVLMVGRIALVFPVLALKSCDPSTSAFTHPPGPFVELPAKDLVVLALQPVSSIACDLAARVSPLWKTV